VIASCQARYWQWSCRPHIIALHDAAIAVEQSEHADALERRCRRRLPADRSTPRSIAARNGPEEAFLDATAAGIERRRRSL
jgi:hypothetical protein